MHSKQHLPISQPLQHQPRIGDILQDTGLISSGQLKVVLQDQGLYHDLRIGEILALRGWVKQQTIDFFVEQWPSILEQEELEPLGVYLKAAGLLDELQIQLILNEQETTGIKFCSLATIKGFLKQETVDFFVQHLVSQESENSHYIEKQEGYKPKRQTRQVSKAEKSEDKRTLTDKEDLGGFLDSDISWLG